ncbi:MAG: PEPxxWA-CTERM sorting domain-containing protein [Phenylobacterium sp.]|nr:PEPxxWA-CTERM sorting domain-containing protein [Phenylobacterium sp.]
MKSFVLPAALAFTCLPAHAVSLITFSDAPRGAFSDTVVEDGFAYSTFSGALLANGITPDRRNMEGQGTGGGGVLSIVAEDGGLFSFLQLDYAAFDQSGLGFQTLTILGLRSGVVIGSDTSTVINTNRSPSVDALHETVGAVGLFGLDLDELRIVLNAGESPQLYFQAVDDIYLQARAVPEPTTWALMIGGFGLAGGALRRRRMALAA